MPVLHFGTGGEIRTLEASLEDSNVSSYITPAGRLAIAECRLLISSLPLTSAELDEDLNQQTNQQSPIRNLQSLEPPIGLEPTPNSFEANRSSVKLRGQEISDFGLRIADLKGAPAGRSGLRTQQSAIRNPQSEIGLVGEDRIELSPRVPRTRMLALHHTPKKLKSKK